MVLKDRLRMFRRERDMTQDFVAEALDVSAQTVFKWERGLYSP